MSQWRSGGGINTKDKQKPINTPMNNGINDLKRIVLLILFKLFLFSIIILFPFIYLKQNQNQNNNYIYDTYIFNRSLKQQHLLLSPNQISRFTISLEAYQCSDLPHAVTNDLRILDEGGTGHFYPLFTNPHYCPWLVCVSVGLWVSSCHSRNNFLKLFEKADHQAKTPTS